MSNRYEILKSVKIFIDYQQHVTELTKFILYHIIYSHKIRHKLKTFGIEYDGIVRYKLV